MLVRLQRRDITPDDYGTLLELDNIVEVKRTISETDLCRLPVATVSAP